LLPNINSTLSLISAASLKRAEAVELIRMRAVLLLKGEEPNVINPKRDELVNKANAPER
jgi:hypothetical protein